eukprot:CAMPEP_0169327930 /NCGR_PEP_ID=MMETSP1017-20121227/12308_1 /TAXON_ID=342587 /ORGANISM="Karlodinium micrum, Strain CCMP2283" /LENGTH=39 /DNA_ID= /DNA_START= /DNA_END= /DNA_ORIENTATION=
MTFCPMALKTFTVHPLIGHRRSHYMAHASQKTGYFIVFG